MKKILILIVSFIFAGNVFAGVTCKNFKQYDITVDAVAAGIEVDPFIVAFGLLSIQEKLNKSGNTKITKSQLIPALIQKECNFDSANGVENFKKNLKKILNTPTEKEVSDYINRMTK